PHAVAVLIGEDDVLEILARRAGGEGGEGDGGKQQQDEDAFHFWLPETWSMRETIVAGEVKPLARCQRPLRASPISSVGVCVSRLGVKTTRDLRRRSISGLSPVTSVQPGRASSFLLQASSRCGVSVAGSTLTEINSTLRLPRRRCTREK